MSLDDVVGYRKPPKSTRFRKGQSGNSARASPREAERASLESVLGQRVTVREDGVERRVDAAEAFLLRLTKQALD